MACPLPDWACSLLSFCCRGWLLYYFFSSVTTVLDHVAVPPTGHTLVRMSLVYLLADSALSPWEADLFVEIHTCVRLPRWKGTSLVQKACWFVFVFLKSDSMRKVFFSTAPLLASLFRAQFNSQNMWLHGGLWNLTILFPESKICVLLNSLVHQILFKILGLTSKHS